MINTEDFKIVIAEELHKCFKVKGRKEPVTALNRLSFNIKSGQLTAFIGPDGAGKTTLMRLLCGLLRPSGGTLSVLGMDSVVNAAEIQSLISYMPQKFGLYEDLSVQENLNLYADLHGVPIKLRKARFTKLLNMTGLTPFTSRLAGKLSGGMKQKLGLACTLVRSPRLLLLDEPTVGVDPLSRRELWEILQKLIKTDKLTVFVSTAYMDEAALCKNVIILHKGNILAQGTPEQLRQTALNRCFMAEPLPALPTRILQSWLMKHPSEIIDAVPEGGRVHFIIRQQDTIIQKLNSIGIRAAKTSERLEDAFMIMLHEYENSENKPACKASAPVELPQIGRLSDTVDIEVKELVRKFGDFTAVANTSFQVHSGEVFGLLGPNGAGKTTTFRMLCGLLPATSGQLSVAGVDLRKARTQARANIGYVAQKFSLYGNLTVQENLEFFAGIYGLSKKQRAERIEEIKQQFDLTDFADSNSADLPGGYKQRLSMAAALMHRPKILFLDEPTSGIDPLARREFWNQITELSVRGTTIIITTHFMEEAEYCDRIMIQDMGRVLAIGTPQQIRQQSGTTAVSMNDVFIHVVEQARIKNDV